MRRAAAVMPRVGGAAILGGGRAETPRAGFEVRQVLALAEFYSLFGACYIEISTRAVLIKPRRDIRVGGL
jgi:hypothetical protein